MKDRTVALSFVASLALLALFAPGPTARQAPDGRAVFEAQKCSACHGIASLGIEAKAKSEAMRGGDLSRVEIEAELLSKYLRKLEKYNEKSHKKEIKIDDNEMKALVDWLRADKS